MSQLSGIKNVDQLILNMLDDEELLKTCKIDKYTWNKVCDDDFFHRRILDKYREIEQYKNERESWKKFFLKYVRYIALMREEFKYNYTFGNFVRQYNLLKKFSNDNYELLMQSSREGQLALVIWSLNKGEMFKNRALREASENGHLEVVKYLVEHGANVNSGWDIALRLASKNGRLNVVKYLVEHGANIHAHQDEALLVAKMYGHHEIVKFLNSI